MSNREEVRIPNLGEFSEVEIVEVLVSVGDHVAIEDPLITLETDKAAMEVPSTCEGTIVELPVQTGMRVSEGDVVVVVETDSAADAPAGEGDHDAAAQSEPEAPDDADPGQGSQADTDSEKESESGTSAAGPVAVQVPDLGEFTEAEIIEVHVKEGDTIAIEDPVITLETDKAAMDVPSTVAGKVLSVSVAVGESVGEGALLIEVEADAAPPSGGAADAGQSGQARADEEKSDQDQSGRDKPGPAREATAGDSARAELPASAAGAPGKLPPIDERSFARAHASPSVRKFARELGVNLADVTPTGKKSRVLSDDVKGYVKAMLAGGASAGSAALPPLPEVDFEKFGEVEVKPLSRIQKISGPRLHASWVHYPHVTQNDEADMTELEERRQKLKNTAADQGVRLTPLAFILKAAAIALHEFPIFNTSMAADGEHLVYKKYRHIGFAADTPHGLMVPVIRDADQKDIMQIARELGELSEKAREGKLTAQQMQGGSFTVSSLGGIGGTTFTPIINPPEVAILGAGRARMQPVWQDDKFVPRLIQPLSLSYDHRVIDGATGVRFTTFLGELLADADRLLLG